MRIGALLLPALVVAGCSLSVPKWGGGRPGEISVSWYCVADPATDSQTCEKRRMRDGRPLDDEVFETIVIPGKDSPPPEVVVPRLPGEAVPWSRNPLQAVNAVDDPGPLEVENLGPELRKPKETVDMWAAHRKKNGGGQGAAQTKAEPQPQPSSTVPPLSKAASPGPARPAAAAQAAGRGGASATNPQGKAPLPGGYTVQLGAFDTAALSDAFIESRNLTPLGVHKNKILSNGAPWWVVTQGSYATEREALAAAREFAPRFPGYRLWVRSWSSIETSRID